MSEMPKDRAGRTWWRDGVLYQIYPRSYLDTNADGIGDLRGIIERLDHLQWLGVEGIWIDPVMPSPNTDWGYDVADYCDVDPALGTLADAEELISEAARRGIHVVMDLVPNHTSDQHRWFVDARSSRDSQYRDYYVWRDPAPGGGPPNNWNNAFNPSEPSWTFDEATGQYYLNSFLPTQPDLNWWNPAVRDEFDNVLRFWFDRGVAGFRIDVVHMIVKDEQLRDNPPSEPDDHWFVRLRGQRQIHNACQPGTHDVLRRWRKIADEYDPPRVLIGETHVHDFDLLASFYGDGDELNLAFNFLMIHASLDAPELRAIVEGTEAALPAGGWPVWTLGNHDNDRFPTRWAGGDPVKTRCALVMLMGLRGTPFLYYGDEIGMPQTPIPMDRIVDPVGITFNGHFGRDGERTPMHWTSAAGGGFSQPGVEPWLPYGDAAATNVEDQKPDPDSVLSLTRDLIGLRDAIPELRNGAYRSVPTDAEGVWVWERGERVVVACNLSDSDATVEGVRGTIRIATDRSRDNEAVDGSVVLAPWQAVIVFSPATSTG
jgi:alpha-glucosidase